MNNLKKSSKVSHISPYVAWVALAIVISFVIVLGLICKKSTLNVMNGGATWINITRFRLAWLKLMWRSWMARFTRSEALVRRQCTS